MLASGHPGINFMTAATPVSPRIYKRATVKPPPHEFTVEVLSPTKQGSRFSYGLRVCPVFRSKGSSDSRSTSSYSEYEIWRRWEDCLDFQETLEDEYSQMSRQKVKVLKRAAGGKRRKDPQDNVFALPRAAASFESLPEGPDPREVAVDVHELIPPLNRKSSVFHVSRSMLKQRETEFAAMISALFNPSEDAPVLLRELRNCTAVRDFFAFWRRDLELSKKSGKSVGRLLHYNHSMLSLSPSTSSARSTNSSSLLTPTSSTRPTSPISLLRHSMFNRRTTGSCEDSPTSAPPVTYRFDHDATPSSPVCEDFPASAPPLTRRFDLDATTSPPISRSMSQTSRPLATAEQISGSILFTDELLLQDDPPTTIESAAQQGHVSDIPPSATAPLPASPEQPPETDHQPLEAFARVPISEDEMPRPQPRARRNSAVMPGYRNARIFPFPPSSALLSLSIAEPASCQSGVKSSNGQSFSTSDTSPTQPSSDLSPTYSPSLSRSRSNSSRPSTMSTLVNSSTSSHAPGSKPFSNDDSNFSYDFELDVDPDVTLSNSPATQYSFLPEVADTRDSDLSDYSRDSVFSIASFRTEASADGVLPFHLRPHADSLPDAARISKSSTPREDWAHARLEQPVLEEAEDILDAYFTNFSDGNFAIGGLDKELPSFIDHPVEDSISPVTSFGSFNCAGVPQSPQSPRDSAVAVKVVYNEWVIVLRAECNMSIQNIRQKIKERFALHECVSLSDDFVLGHLPSRTSVTNGRGLRGRSNSIASKASDVTQVHLLRTEIDWGSVMSTCDGKVVLQVFDAEPQLRG